MNIRTRIERLEQQAAGATAVAAAGRQAERVRHLVESDPALCSAIRDQATAHPGGVLTIEGPLADQFLETMKGTR